MTYLWLCKDDLVSKCISVGDFVMHYATQQIAQVEAVGETLTGRQTFDLQGGARGLHAHEINFVLGVKSTPVHVSTMVSERGPSVYVGTRYYVQTEEDLVEVDQTLAKRVYAWLGQPKTQTSLAAILAWEKETMDLQRCSRG